MEKWTLADESHRIAICWAEFQIPQGSLSFFVSSNLSYFIRSTFKDNRSSQVFATVNFEV